MKVSIFWDLAPRNPLKVNKVSEEYIASIFRAEGSVKQEANIK
jgi:hypothetical protein